MLGEIFAYSLGKAAGRRKYRKKRDSGPAYCYGCANEIDYECQYVYDYCTDCCNCTAHS